MITTSFIHVLDKTACAHPSGSGGCWSGRTRREACEAARTPKYEFQALRVKFVKSPTFTSRANAPTGRTTINTQSLNKNMCDALRWVSGSGSASASGKTAKTWIFTTHHFRFFDLKIKFFESVGPTPTPPTTKPTLKIYINHQMSIGGGLRLLAPLRAELHPKTHFSNSSILDFSSGKSDVLESRGPTTTPTTTQQFL